MWIFPPNPTRGFPDPKNYWIKPVFLWIPEYFWPEMFQKGRLPCPNCKTDTNVTSEGWNPNCRSAIIQDQCCRILSFRYKCTLCSENARKNKGDTRDGKKTYATFNGYDEKVLNLLPSHIKDSFPFIITARSGIHISLLDKLADDLMHGKGFNATAKYIAQSHLTHFHQYEHIYYSHVSEYRKLYLDLSGQKTITNRSIILESPPPFGTFEDLNSYSGHYPSEHFLETAWNIYFSFRAVMTSAKENRCFTREEYFHRRQQLIDGTIWCGDASHKLAKLVIVKEKKPNLGDSVSSPLHGIFTIMNEFEQVLWQRPLFSASLSEMKAELKLTLLKRFISHGYHLPQIYYTDECCEDRSLLISIFQELESENHYLERLHVEGTSTNATDMFEYDYLTFPPQKLPTYICSEGNDIVAHACDTLRQKADESKLDGRPGRIFQNII